MPSGTASYEVLNSFVMNMGQDQPATIVQLSTVSMQNQVVSIDHRNTLEEMQTSLASVLMSITQRLDKETKPQADRIMQALLRILTAPPAALLFLMQFSAQLVRSQMP